MQIAKALVQQNTESHGNKVGLRTGCSSKISRMCYYANIGRIRDHVLKTQWTRDDTTKATMVL